MWPFLTRLIDIILPRKERVIRIDDYLAEEIPLVPQEHAAFGFSITTLMEYRATIVEDLIRALKYDASEHAAALLSTVLAEYLREEIASKKAFSTLPVVLVPMPLHTARQAERGFNQIETVLNALPHEFHNGSLSRVVHALERTRPTRQQTRLSRDERFHNVAGAFKLAFPDLIRDTHVYLIDDVTTTGATLAEAARPLTPIAASVTLLALARA